MKEKNQHNNKGFTLVELIVTLVILSVISAIMMPSFLSYIDDVKTQQDVIRAKELMVKAQDYFDELYADDFASPNVNKDGNLANGLVNWGGKAQKNISGAVAYAKDFKEKSGLWTGQTKKPSDMGKNGLPDYGENCPYNLCFIVGRTDEYGSNNDPRIKRKAYTVFGIIYQREPGVNAVCFDGEQWITDMKGKDIFSQGTENRIYINKQKIIINLYFVNGFVGSSGGNERTILSELKNYGNTYEGRP